MLKNVIDGQDLLRKKSIAQPSKLSTNIEESKEKLKLTENKFNNSSESVSKLQNQVLQDNIHMNSKIELNKNKSEEMLEELEYDADEQSSIIKETIAETLSNIEELKDKLKLTQNKFNNSLESISQLQNSFLHNFLKNQNLMYGYGPSFSDITLPKNDDSFYKLDLNYSFPFFGNFYTTMYINTNGLVTFLSGVSSSSSIFPSSSPMIAPFHTDIDTKKGGQIYFRESHSNDDVTNVLTDILRLNKSAKFNPSKIYIITWYNVYPHDIYSYSYQNTFQLVLTTDGTSSFGIFNYFNLEWPNYSYSKDTIFGYNAGDNRTYYKHRYSKTKSINYIQSNSNVYHPGKWIFKFNL